MKQRVNMKTSVLNVLGTIGYVIALFQWFWVVIIFLPSIARLEILKGFFEHTENIPAPPQIVMNAGTGPSWFVTLIGYVLAAIVLSGILYGLIAKIPRTIAKTGETITHKPAAIIAPIVVRHVHLTPKEKQTVPTWLIAIVKILIIFIPLSLLVFASTLRLVLSFEVIMLVGVVLFSWSFFVFALQFLLARFLKVDYKTIR